MSSAAEIAVVDEGWLQKSWRPAMGWSYFVICLTDFIFFPVFYAVWFPITDFHEWHPLTLQGGGLYHLSMGAIIGVTSWRRSDEKMAALTAANGSVNVSTKTVTESSTVKTAPTASSRGD